MSIYRLSIVDQQQQWRQSRVKQPYCVVDIERNSQQNQSISSSMLSVVLFVRLVSEAALSGEWRHNRALLPSNGDQLSSILYSRFRSPSRQFQVRSLVAVCAREEERTSSWQQDRSRRLLVQRSRENRCDFYSNFEPTWARLAMRARRERKEEEERKEKTSEQTNKQTNLQLSTTTNSSLEHLNFYFYFSISISIRISI